MGINDYYAFYRGSRTRVAAGDAITEPHYLSDHEFLGSQPTECRVIIVRRRRLLKPERSRFNISGLTGFPAPGYGGKGADWPRNIIHVGMVIGPQTIKPAYRDPVFL